MEKLNITGPDFNRTQEIKEEVQHRIVAGETREVIYSDLRSRYHEEYLIAQIMCSVLDPDDIDRIEKRSKKLRVFLIIWAAMSMIMNTLAILGYAVDNVNYLFVIPVGFIVPLFVIWYSKKMIIKKDPLDLSLISIFSFLFFVNSLNGLIDSTILQIGFALVPLFISLLICLFSRSIKKEFFPQFKLSGIKQKKDGSYFIGLEDFRQYKGKTNRKS